MAWLLWLDRILVSVFQWTTTCETMEPSPKAFNGLVSLQDKRDWESLFVRLISTVPLAFKETTEKTIVKLTLSCFIC